MQTLRLRSAPGWALLPSAILAITSSASSARAEETSNVAREGPPAEMPSTPARRLAVTLNPLRFALSAFFRPQGSLNVEWLVATHHAIAVSPSLLVGGGADRFEPSSASRSLRTGAKPLLVNLEAGWRFYSGRQLNGFFVGLFVLAAEAKEVYPSRTESWWNAYVGLDVGGQHVFANGITVGAGVGYQNLVLGESTPGTDSYLGGGKVMPRGTLRLLLAFGYAF